MTKELAFQQPAGNCGAIDLDHRMTPAPATLMNGSRDQFFAGAGLTQQEHRRI